MLEIFAITSNCRTNPPVPIDRFGVLRRSTHPAEEGIFHDRTIGYEFLMLIVF
jgi:hypothetical protein